MEKPQEEAKLHTNILNARKNKGFSQTELGNMLGVSRQTISNWEKGQSVPDVSSLEALEQYLDIPLEELLGKGATREALEKSPGLSNEVIAKHLAKLTTLYALELERRKEIEEKFNKHIRIISYIVLIAIIVLLLVKMFLFPSRVEIDSLKVTNFDEEANVEGDTD